MVELQLKVDDIVRIKTLTEIVLANPDTVHGVVTIDTKNNKYSIASGDKLSINGNGYSYGMYEQGGRIGKIIALLPGTWAIVDVARTGEYNYCYRPDWLELYDNTKEAILSEEIMNLI